MQNLIMYAVAESTLGIVRDYANARGLNPPIFTRDFPAVLKLRLFAEIDNTDAYDITLLDGISSWQCVWDKDFNTATVPPIMADGGGIYVQSITENINGTDRVFTEIVIPISNMNSAELIAAMGTAEVFSGLNMELVGYDASASPMFGLQIKGFSVRNRIYNTGTPTEVEPEYLNAAQVRALIASGAVLQFSADNTNWHDEQLSADLYVRFRSASDASAQWSIGIKLPSGGGGGGSSVIVDDALSTTSTNPVQNAVITTELNKKIANPNSGTSGQVLTIDSNGNIVWATPSGGGGTTITVDSALSTTSTNPVQNAVITNKINELVTTINEISSSVSGVETELATIATTAEGI